MKQKERWILENRKGDFRALAAACGVDPLIGKLMVNRGISTEEEARVYLHGTLRDLNDPRLLKDAEKAAGLLAGAARRGERVAIASDYDDDGIFSAYILRIALKKVGAQARIYTPDRIREGYGLNERIVREAAEDGCTVLLTCDNGIAAFEAADLAKELGLTVIVTDHHEVPFRLTETGGKEEIPVRADAVVDPKQSACAYPFDGLCGAGVAFQLIRILYDICGLPREAITELLPFTAIATVADVMDLTGDNRILVREGLRLLQETRHPGLRALIEISGLSGRKLTAYHIGFVIGPCFNAAGRLMSVKEAFDLLDSKTAGEAAERASALREINETRKKMTQEGLEEALRLVEEGHLDRDPVMTVLLPGCHESLIGLIAGRLREQYHHPIYVFTETENGLKGSGRSIEAYSMYEKLSACKDLLTRFGGHPMAAGLSLPRENYEELKCRLNEACGLTPADLLPEVRIDAAMPIGYVSPDLIRQMELLEPTGKGNRSPLFAERHFVLERAVVMGKTRNAVRLQIRDARGDKGSAVWFGEADRFLAFLEEAYGKKEAAAVLSGGGRADIALCYVPQINDFRGEESVQLLVRHYCRIEKGPETA